MRKSLVLGRASLLVVACLFAAGAARADQNETALEEVFGAAVEHAVLAAQSGGHTAGQQAGKAGRLEAETAVILWDDFKRPRATLNAAGAGGRSVIRGSSD